MKYVYRMPLKMFMEVSVEAKESKMSIRAYITKNFGIRGECIKVEVF